MDVKAKLAQIKHALREKDGINKEILQSVEKISKEKSKKEEEHVDEMDEVIAEVKTSTTVAVWEAKIKLVEVLDNARSWNVVGWHEALDMLTNKLVDASQDPTLHPMDGG